MVCAESWPNNHCWERKCPELSLGKWPVFYLHGSRPRLGGWHSILHAADCTQNAVLSTFLLAWSPVGADDKAHTELEDMDWEGGGVFPELCSTSRGETWESISDL